MKKSIKKIISVIICSVMLLSMCAVFSSAADYADPVFEVKVVSETNNQVTVSIDLVSGSFNCADFTFQSASGYTCTSIAPSAIATSSGAFGQVNPLNGKVSVLFQNLYSKTGSFYTATFTKPAGSSYKSGDVKVNFTNCSILENGETIVLFPVVNYEMNITLSATELAMDYKSSATLSYEAVVAQGSTVVWYSSNSDVATVDENGNVYAAGKGEATITCAVVDAAGNVLVQADCNVTVSYTVGQWFIIIFLLGFLWFI